MDTPRSERDLTKLSRVLCLMLGDTLLLALSQFLTLLFRFEFNIPAIMESGFLTSLMGFFPVSEVLMLAIFTLLGLYQSLWAYAGMEEGLHIVGASLILSGVQFVLMRVLSYPVPRSFPFLHSLLLMLLVGAFRYSYRVLRTLWRIPGRRRTTRVRTMVVGAGEAGSMLVRDLNNSENSRNRVVCFIDDDKSKVGSVLRGVRVAGTRNDIGRLAERYQVEEIILAIPTAPTEERRKILRRCQDTGCQVKLIPSLTEIASGRVSIQQARNIQIEDLLGRDSGVVTLDEIAGYVEGKTVLVTGGGGSIGSELCRQIAMHHPRELLIFDIYENNAYDIQQELKRTHPELKLTVRIGSVRDKERVERLFEEFHPDIVYHAAAHKHVPRMEDSPNEAIKNNVVGTYNTASAASRHGCGIFVLISSDKAVNPTNVRGATKRICEMIVQMFSQHSGTKFVAVRFGNVLGSSGSVIPLFRRQIEQGGPVTVTHKDIIRYFMTISEAVSLVMQAGAYAKGGEIFVLDMGEPVRIDDLARNMIRLSGYEPDKDIEIRYTGLRPGEKLYEELLMNEEGMRSTKNKLIFIGRPIEIDEPVFLGQLRRLRDLAEQNDPDIKKALEQVVPTYHITDNADSAENTGTAGDAEDTEEAGPAGDDEDVPAKAV